MKPNIDFDKTAFSQWELLEDDNLDLNEIKIRFFDLPNKLVLATSELDNYYKIFYLSQCLQMVIGGLKPATSFAIDKQLIKLYQYDGLLNEFSLEDFNRTLFEYFNLRLTEKVDGYNDSKENYLIYNPKSIKDICTKYPDLSPYSEEDINIWIANNSRKGVNVDYLYGLIYGYPVSAVKQFVKYQNHQTCRVVNRKTISNYGEAYIVWAKHLKRDVVIRETIKETFFKNLAHNTVYLKFIKDLNDIAKPYREISRLSFERIVNGLIISGI